MKGWESARKKKLLKSHCHWITRTRSFNKHKTVQRETFMRFVYDFTGELLQFKKGTAALQAFL
jgi:hypothetical protein